MAATPPGREVDFLEALPDELAVHVLSYCDYPTHLKLAAVNHYHRQFVNPQACSVDEKEAFIQNVQTWRKHNQCHVENIGNNVIKRIRWTSNGFACYTCFRVLERHHFSLRQTKDKLDKGSPSEGQPRSKRFCIACGFILRKYRHGTTFKLPYNQTMYLFSANPKIEYSLLKHTWCAVCRELHFNNATAPTDLPTGQCDHTASQDRSVKASRNMVTTFKQGHYDLMNCRQCDTTTMRLALVTCSFCGGEVCTRCGVPSTATYWWCGRTCSAQAIQLIKDCRSGVLPLQPRAIELLDDKAADRAWRAATEHDVLSEDGGEDSMLDMLYSFSIE